MKCQLTAINSYATVEIRAGLLSSFNLEKLCEFLEKPQY